MALSGLYAHGSDVNWAEYHRDFKAAHVVLDLPAYHWDLEEYWIQYTNYWSLFKGEPPTETANIRNVAEPKPPLVGLQGATIHKILEETVGPLEGRLVVEGDMMHPDLNSLVQGHKVNGIPLCTPVGLDQIHF